MSDAPKDQQSEGRRRNGAEPLGRRSGLTSDRATVKTGRKELDSPGPGGVKPADVAGAVTGQPKKRRH